MNKLKEDIIYKQLKREYENAKRNEEFWYGKEGTGTEIRRNILKAYKEKYNEVGD